MSTEAAKEVGQRLRSARLERGLTQLTVANELDKRQATISAWEQGHTVPGVDDLYQLAELLDRDVHDFLPPRLPEPPRAITRALHEELPLGARFQGSLELFLQIAAIHSPPEKAVHLSASEPAELAKELVASSGTPGPPIDVMAVSQTCGARVLGWRAMNDSLAGLLVELEDGPLIAFNAGHSVGRQRFTVAHELGHLLLGHLDTFHVDLSAQAAIPEGSGYKSAHEKEANTFAANLLMPESWVRDLGEDIDIEECAKRFEVSTLAFGYRLMALGLREDPESGASQP
jgi:Zn-dependent peptidase ImmA (M78 family)/DNA-binding XRE family transcriptional regulator